MDLSIWGGATHTPKVALWIPEDEWNRLSSVDQGNLGYYVKSKVPSIRADPGPHTGLVSKAPIYSRVVANCRKMSDDAWMIGVGHINSEGELSYDREVANGRQSPWGTNENPK